MNSPNPTTTFEYKGTKHTISIDYKESKMYENNYSFDFNVTPGVEFKALESVVFDNGLDLGNLIERCSFKLSEDVMATMVAAENGNEKGYIITKGKGWNDPHPDRPTNGLTFIGEINGVDYELMDYFRDHDGGPSEEGIYFRKI